MSSVGPPVQQNGESLDKISDDHSQLRINVSGLVRLLFYALLLPATIAILLDFWLDLFPVFTLATLVTLFPIAGFFILRNTLREMNQIMEQVAPKEVAEEEVPEEEVSAADAVMGLESAADSEAEDGEAALQKADPHRADLK